MLSTTSSQSIIRLTTPFSSVLSDSHLTRYLTVKSSDRGFLLFPNAIDNSLPSKHFQRIGDKAFIFYSDVQKNHDYNALMHAQPREPDYDKFRNRATASIGVATIRRDGFVSMDAGHLEGSLLTHLFTWQENRTLHVNTDVETGELTIDCLDESKHVLASTAFISGKHVDRKYRSWDRHCLSRAHGSNCVFE